MINLTEDFWLMYKTIISEIADGFVIDLLYLHYVGTI